MNYLLTMAHGAEHYRQEAVYLLLSWLRQRAIAAQAGRAPATCTVLVATDRPESFLSVIGAHAEVVYLELTPEQLLEWRGGAQGYVHRIKPQLIAHAAQTLGAGSGDALMFVDSDTAFIADPDPLFDAIHQGQVVLHAREGSIEGNRRHSRSQGRLFEMARRHRFDYAGQRQQLLAPALPLWNSGAVGLRGDEVAPLMAETLALTDQICTAMPLPTAEQVALSAVLAAHRRQVVPAESRLLHYHVFKEFRADIARFLERHGGAGPQRLVELSAQIDPQQRIQPKLAFNRLPKWRRQLQKHLGHGWRALPYPWDT